MNAKAGCSTPKKKRECRGELARDEKKSRKQLFSAKWLNEDIFKKWLEPVHDDNRKAKCKACNTVLGAKRSDLVNHVGSQRHKKSVKATDHSKSISQVRK